MRFYRVPARDDHPDPLLCKNIQGVLYQTGGRRIPIRGRIGLRSGKMGNRGTREARIGIALNSENGGFRGVVLGGVYGVEWRGRIFPEGKFFRGFFWGKRFQGIFLAEYFFWKNSGKTFCRANDFVSDFFPDIVLIVLEFFFMNTIVLEKF